MRGCLPKEIKNRIVNDVPINSNHEIVTIHRNGNEKKIQLCNKPNILEKQKEFDGVQQDDKRHKYEMDNKGVITINKDGEKHIWY